MPTAIPGGYVGVDVFFVISGYLISGIILRQLQQGRFSVARFYERRLRRIFPALSIVLSASLLFGYLVFFQDEYRLLGKHTLAAALFSSNFVLYRESGYFDSAAYTKPLLHLWSLGIEEQFYLAWPLCLIAFYKRRRLIPYLCAAMGAVSLLMSMALSGRHQSAAFYLPICRFWELLIGCLLVATEKRNALEPMKGKQHGEWAVNTVTADILPERMRDAFSVIGCSLIVTSALLLTKHSIFPGYLALLPSAGSALVILAGPDSILNRSVLRSRILVWFGLVSYPLYLWHWPILSFAQTLLVRSPSQLLGLVALSVFLSWLTYRFVERSVRAGRFRNDMIFLPLALAGIGLMGMFVYGTRGATWRNHLSTSQGLVSDITDSYLGVECAQRPPGFEFCSQSRPGPPDAAIIGDSHADHLFPGVARVDIKRNWLLVGKNSCPPMIGIALPGDTNGCVEVMQNAFRYVSDMDRVRTVVLSFYGHYGDTTDVAKDHLLNGKGPSNINIFGDTGRSRAEAFASGLGAAARLLTGRGKRVIFVIDVPELPFLPRECAWRPLRQPSIECSVSRAEIALRQRTLRQALSRIQQETPNVHLFDPLSELCDGDPCLPVMADRTYYRDSHHLSVRGSERVAAALLPIVTQQESAVSTMNIGAAMGQHDEHRR